MSHVDHRSGLTRDEILEALADGRLHQLTNWGDKWGISYRFPVADKQGFAELFDADFDRLIERWALLLAKWDEAQGA